MTSSWAMSWHLVAGIASVGFFWAALLTRKGSRRHRTAGRGFLVFLLLATASVGPLLLARTGGLTPDRVVQMIYLSLCVVAVSLLAWTAIRFRRHPERYSPILLKAGSWIMLVLGGVVLLAGILKADPVPAVLSWVGLAAGTLLRQLARSLASLHPQWWLSLHLHSVLMLFTAAHGTMLFVVWRGGVNPDATRLENAGFHVLVLLVAIGLRVWWGRRLGVPMTFSAAGSRVATRTELPIETLAK